MELTVKQNIDTKRIADLMISAFEGGITYWCQSAHLTKEPAEKLSDSIWYAAPELYDGREFEITVTHDATEGDEDQQVTVINQDNIKRGLELMSSKSPRHWGDFIAENDDAITADVFFQYVMFGDIVFG